MVDVSPRKMVRAGQVVELVAEIAVLIDRCQMKKESCGRESGECSRGEAWRRIGFLYRGAQLKPKEARTRAITADGRG
jgi:hypothetical protein